MEIRNYVSAAIVVASLSGCASSLETVSQEEARSSHTTAMNCIAKKLLDSDVRFSNAETPRVKIDSREYWTEKRATRKKGFVDYKTAGLVDIDEGLVFMPEYAREESWGMEFSKFVIDRDPRISKLPQYRRDHWEGSVAKNYVKYCPKIFRVETAKNEKGYPRDIEEMLKAKIVD